MSIYAIATIILVVVFFIWYLDWREFLIGTIFIIITITWIYFITQYPPSIKHVFIGTLKTLPIALVFLYVVNWSVEVKYPKKLWQYDDEDTKPLTKEEIEEYKKEGREWKEKQMSKITPKNLLNTISNMFNWKVASIGIPIGILMTGKFWRESGEFEVGIMTLVGSFAYFIFFGFFFGIIQYIWGIVREVRGKKELDEDLSLVRIIQFILFLFILLVVGVYVWDWIK